MHVRVLLVGRHRFAWMKKGTPAGELRKDNKVVPLPQDEGGTCEPLNAEAFKARKHLWKEGGKYTGLGCLPWLDLNISYPGLTFQENQIEGLARKIFATQVGSAAHAPPAPDGSDRFWEDNSPRFPKAWPAGCTIPVLVRDTARMPAFGKFQLLGLDELVLAFWKMYDRTCKLCDSLQAKSVAILVRRPPAPSTVQSSSAECVHWACREGAGHGWEARGGVILGDLARGSVTGGVRVAEAAAPDDEKVREALTEMLQEKERATQLQRNVPMTFHYADGDTEARVLGSAHSRS